MSRAGGIWKVRRDVSATDIIAADERLTWGRTIGFGMQHVIAMFGATVLIPIFMKFPPQTALFFSGIGTLLFLLVVKNQIPSYLGSSAAFVGPALAAQADGGYPVALGGIVVAGLLFFLIGLLVDRRGTGFIELLMPPIVTGSIVAVIGLNLAPIAAQQIGLLPGEGQNGESALLGFVTLVAILLISVVFKGFIGRLSIFLGVAIGYLFAVIIGAVEFTGVGDAAWLGLPEFQLPSFDGRAILLMIPAVLVLIAENTGHVKAVGTMTERDLDPLLGRAFMGDGLSTAIAGTFGGAGTTTYAENIGVMAATKVYSTAAYFVAGITAVLIGLVPKFSALITTIPSGVLGGASTALFGLIAILGARIWVEGRVDFRDPVNLFTASVAVIAGAGNYTLVAGDFEFSGIAIGSFGAIIIYQVLKAIRGHGGAVDAPRSTEERRIQP
jgi:uracil-xanthine permease